MKLGSRLTLLFLPLAAAFGLGCSNPGGAYDDFKHRYQDDLTTSSMSASSSSSGGMGGSGGGGSCLPMPGEVDGDYFVALSSNLSPPNPLLLSGKLKTAEMAGSLEMTLTVQAIDAKDRKTKVGNVITFPPAKVGADGSFVLMPGDLTVDGHANPLIYGTDIKTTGVTMSGTLCKPATFVCGNLDGMITTPIADNLSSPQSTWTMVPYDGTTAPNPIYIDCGKMKTAGPPPM
jgi:hypothetical protein